MPVEVSNSPTISMFYNTLLYAANIAFLCEIVCAQEKKLLIALFLCWLHENIRYNFASFNYPA